MSDGGNLVIYYSGTSLSDPSYSIYSWCNRWTIENYTVTIETTISKSDYNKLITHCLPGSIGEMLGTVNQPKFYDKTWSGENTIKISPSSNTRLNGLREEKVMYVKNLTTGTLEANDNLLSVKIVGNISGTRL